MPFILESHLRSLNITISVQWPTLVFWLLQPVAAKTYFYDICILDSSTQVYGHFGRACVCSCSANEPITTMPGKHTNLRQEPVACDYAHRVAIDMCKPHMIRRGAVKHVAGVGSILQLLHTCKWIELVSVKAHLSLNRFTQTMILLDMLVRQQPAIL